MQTLQQQWAQCQTILADNLTTSAYQTWFAPIVPLMQHIDATVVSADSLLVDLKAHPKRYVHFSLFGKKDK